jgi:hypothetical protein
VQDACTPQRIRPIFEKPCAEMKLEFEDFYPGKILLSPQSVGDFLIHVNLLVKVDLPSFEGET